MTATPRLFKPVANDAGQGGRRRCWRRWTTRVLRRGVPPARLRRSGRAGPPGRLPGADPHRRRDGGQRVVPEPALDRRRAEPARRRPLRRLPLGAGQAPRRGGRRVRPAATPPMQRAVAFWSTIADSERFARQFEQVAEAYFDQLEAGPDGEDITALTVPTRHVDGTTRISSRRADIRWLKDDPPEGECRVLTNAKCLTEGVDVPALDAVMFLTPRRVEDRHRPGRRPGDAQAARASSSATSSCPSPSPPGSTRQRRWTRTATTTPSGRCSRRCGPTTSGSTPTSTASPCSKPPAPAPIDPIKVIPVDLDRHRATPPPCRAGCSSTRSGPSAIYTKIVQKVGTRTYWEDWARDVAADRRAPRDPHHRASSPTQPDAADAFDEFLAELHATLNDGIGRDDAVSMVSQHLITRPIFEALFGDDAFAAANPVSQAMTGIVDGARRAQPRHRDRQARRLLRLHPPAGRGHPPRRRRGPPEDHQGPLRPLLQDRLPQGRRLPRHRLHPHRGRRLHHPRHRGRPRRALRRCQPLRRRRARPRPLHRHRHLHHPAHPVRVHPPRGPGPQVRRASCTPTRSCCSPTTSPRSTSRPPTARSAPALDGADPGYEPFPGIVLTDTFQLGETGEGTGTWDVFPINNERATRQKGLDIRVILGNPPYSAGQESANDDNANLKYPTLDASIAATYAKRSTATLKNSLYDSYIRAIRWASDRLLGSPTEASSPSSPTAATSTPTPPTAFGSASPTSSTTSTSSTSAATSARPARSPAGKAARSSTPAAGPPSRSPCSSSSPATCRSQGAVLHYRDIGDYLTRDQKLEILAAALPAARRRRPRLDALALDEHHAQRRTATGSINGPNPLQHISLGCRATGRRSSRSRRTMGLKTSRDAWNYNSSRSALDANVTRMIEHFNSQVDAFAASKGPVAGIAEGARGGWPSRPSTSTPTKFSWDRRRTSPTSPVVTPSAIATAWSWSPPTGLSTGAGSRPVAASTTRVYQLPRVFPDRRRENLAIGVPRHGGAAEPLHRLLLRDLPDDQRRGRRQRRAVPPTLRLRGPRTVRRSAAPPVCSTTTHDRLGDAAATTSRIMRWRCTGPSTRRSRRTTSSSTSTASCTRPTTGRRSPPT